MFFYLRNHIETLLVAQEYIKFMQDLKGLEINRDFFIYQKVIRNRSELICSSAHLIPLCSTGSNV